MTILQTFEHTATTWGWSWWFTIPILVAILCIVVIVWACLNAKKCESAAQALITIGAVGVLFCFLVIIPIAKTYTKLPTTYTYQVILNNEIDIQEFAEKYEILEQQGITYIIREKE